MKIEHVRFVLAVPDLAVSSAYYQKVLGFDIRPFGDPGWRLYVKDKCWIMAGECREALPPRALGDHSYFAYLLVNEIEAYYAHVQSQGAELIKPLQAEPWGMKEFGVRTVDGHRIMFAAPLP